MNRRVMKDFFSKILENINSTFYVNAVTFSKINDGVFLWVGITGIKVDDDYGFPKLENVDFSQFKKISYIEIEEFVEKEMKSDSDSYGFNSYNIWKKNEVNSIRENSNWEILKIKFNENGYLMKEIFFLRKRKYITGFGMEMFFLIKVVPDLVGNKRGKWIASKTGIVESFSEFVKLISKL